VTALASFTEEMEKLGSEGSRGPTGAAGL